MRGKVLKWLHLSSNRGITPARAGKRLCIMPPEIARARITPARAGKRRTRAPRTSKSRDHPRACGEKEKRWGWRTVHQGSPPRVRGKDLMPAYTSGTPGITPARAGKSEWYYWTNIPAQDHPRACGEKRIPMASWNSAAGSPPRVRGKGADCLHVVARPGITPARAGKS